MVVLFCFFVSVFGVNLPNILGDEAPATDSDLINHINSVQTAWKAGHNKRYVIVVVVLVGSCFCVLLFYQFFALYGVPSRIFLVTCQYGGGTSCVNGDCVVIGWVV